MRGRPPAWNDFGQLQPRLWTEVVAVATLDRVTLPAPIRQRIPFLSTKEPVGVLAVLKHPGQASIVPMSPDGLATLDAARVLISRAPATERDELILAAMSKYTRLSIETSGRFALPDGLAAHLQATQSGGFRVVASNGKLDFWSEGSWVRHQAAQGAQLPE